MGNSASLPERALIATLDSAYSVLRDLIGAIPPERLEIRRKPHFWTIREHVSHLAEVQPMLTGRLERFRDDPSPSFLPYLPSGGGQPTETVATDDAAEPLAVGAALTMFGRWRNKQIALIESLPANVWTKQAVHPEFELYTASILVRHIAMHDHWHMYRIEELWITKDAYLTEVD